MAQYVDSLRERLQTWLSVTKLPDALKKELGRLDLAEPVPSDQPLSLMGTQATALLDEYVETRKDDAYRAMLFGRGPQQKQQSKAKSAAPATASFAQSSEQFHPPGPQGQGRGQARGKGRGKFRGKGRGRGSTSKPSASASRP